MNTKRRLFHILNERARKKDKEQEQREEDMFYNILNDPRRKDTLSWIEPLIEDEQLKKKVNLTARLAARITRGARNGDIVGFAAVCLMGDGKVQTTWYSDEDKFLTLSGGATYLFSEISHYQVQQRNVQGLPISRKKKMRSANCGLK